MANSIPLDYCVADYIADRLETLNIHHLFEVPGDFMTDFLNVVLDRHPKLPLIHMPNELIAGYAADGYARLNGFGVVSVTYGVGAFSLLTALAGSYVERNPVILLNGCPSTSDRKYEHQKGVLIHHSTGKLTSNLKIFNEVTVEAIVIDSPEAVTRFDEAIASAYRWKRPIYVEVWKDMWTKPCNRPASPLRLELPKSDPANLQAVVTQLSNILNKAKNPLAWAGIELQRYGFTNAFLEVLDQWALPYITTLLAKSVLPESHPQFRGVYTGAASSDSIKNTVNQSDWILGFGTLITDDYLDLINSRYEYLVVMYDGEVRIQDQVYKKVYLNDVLSALKSNPLPKPRKPIVAPAPKLETLPPTDNSLTFNSFFDVMRGWLSPDWNIVIDESNSLYVGSNLKRDKANTFISEAAWGSIGYATPAAIGISLATGRRTIVFAGDGGFRMIAQSIESLIAGTVVFVMNNSIYGIEQALIDDTAFSNPAAFKSYNLFPTWDYLALAQAFGVSGYKVTTLTELKALLPTLKANKNKVSLVEVVIPATDLPRQIKNLAEGYTVPPVL
jgi:indolepyruvate decarboxylase